MSSFEEGAPVTVGLNEAGKMIDIHRFTLEMNFDERPRAMPGNVIQVNGTVTKIQSGLIYVKTPAGQTTISANTAPADGRWGMKCRSGAVTRIWRSTILKKEAQTRPAPVIIPDVPPSYKLMLPQLRRS